LPHRASARIVAPRLLSFWSLNRNIIANGRRSCRCNWLGTMYFFAI
jgi:hypothetical protein